MYTVEYFLRAIRQVAESINGELSSVKAEPVFERRRESVRSPPMVEPEIR